MATKQDDACRVVAIIADIHAGSTVALLPPGFRSLEGQEIGQSPWQRWLWKCWLKTEAWLNDVTAGDAWALVFNGDLVEGVHHGTKQIVSPDVNDHVEIALHVVRNVAKKATKCFMVRGTECHTNNTELVIGKALRLERNRETGLPAWDRLTLDICGIRCVVRHHIPTAVRPYLEASQYSIQAASEIVEAVRNHEPTPRVLCCAHRHRFGSFSDGHSLTVVSPPWQGLTRYGHKLVPQARTRPGAYVLDWRGIPNGQLPKVHELLFDAPAPKAVKL